MGLGTDALIARHLGKFRPNRGLSAATSEWEPPLQATTNWYYHTKRNSVEHTYAIT